MVTVRGGATPRDDGFVGEAESHPMSDNGYDLSGVCLTITLSRDQRLLAEVIRSTECHSIYNYLSSYCGRLQGLTSDLQVGQKKSYETNLVK